MAPVLGSLGVDVDVALDGLNAQGVVAKHHIVASLAVAAEARTEPQEGRTAACPLVGC